MNAQIDRIIKKNKEAGDRLTTKALRLPLREARELKYRNRNRTELIGRVIDSAKKKYGKSLEIARLKDTIKKTNGASSKFLQRRHAEAKARLAGLVSG